MSAHGSRAAALVCALALFATACGRESEDGVGGPARGGRSDGSIVIAAEQLPPCLNSVNVCADSLWLGWTVSQHILPKAMTITPEGTFEASALLVRAPSLDNSGIRESPFRITYTINPDAVWDDGSPITSADFEFTWQAHLQTKGSIFTNGYDKIASIDTSDPRAAVVHFKETFAGWQDLFGGSTDFVLKKAAFPNGPELSRQMTTSVPFSGGPWKIKMYSPAELVLVRNDRYWGPKPKLDQVTIVPREEPNAQITSLLTGEVAAIYPRPSVEMPRRLKSNAAVKYMVGGGTAYEGLWLNLDKPPLDDKAVREALFWATDREAVVEAIVEPINPDAEPLNCAGWVPTIGTWCDNSDFAEFHYDVSKAKQLLEGAGWTLGDDGIYAKDGRRLSLQFTTTTGDKSREDTQALLKEKWRSAGIEAVIENFESRSPIFTDVLPKGNFAVALYAQVASPDPSVAAIYACDQIPTADNGYTGQNLSRWCNREASDLARETDRTVDESKRLEMARTIGDLVRQDLVWLPMYQRPVVTAWRTDKLAGPVGEYNETALSGFYNLAEWSAP